MPDLPPSVPTVSYDENILIIGSDEIGLEANIKQILPLHKFIIVLLDPFSGLNESNLLSINYSGDEVWRAELPSGYGIRARSFSSITNIESLRVHSAYGFYCQIDPSSGKIIDSIFTK